jgi:hypothetical protein
LQEAHDVVGPEAASAELLLRARHKTACTTEKNLKEAVDNKLLVSSVRKLIDDLNGYLKRAIKLAIEISWKPGSPGSQPTPRKGLLPLD